MSANDSQTSRSVRGSPVENACSLSRPTISALRPCSSVVSPDSHARAAAVSGAKAETLPTALDPDAPCSDLESRFITALRESSQRPPRRENVLSESLQKDVRFLSRNSRG